MVDHVSTMIQFDRVLDHKIGMLWSFPPFLQINILQLTQLAINKFLNAIKGIFKKDAV